MTQLNLKTITKNNEHILPICFFGNNRNHDVLDYHKKVLDFFQIPMNYIFWDFSRSGHGDAAQWLVNNTLHLNHHYYWFLDMDAIPLRKDFVDIMYNKIRDKQSVFGPALATNHRQYSDHIYAGLFCLAFAKDWYIKLAKPTLTDIIERSDNGQELTWQTQLNGGNVDLLYPSSYNNLTNEEMRASGNPEHFNLGRYFKYGLGTCYGDMLFHGFMQLLPRSSEVFIEKCQQILGTTDVITVPRKDDVNFLEGVIVCVNYGDILELTLPENKKHFDNLVVVTSANDIKTKSVCNNNNVKCIETNVFYENGAIFNKSAAMNLAYKNLRRCDWCINLDADIILPDNFRHTFFSYLLNKNELYGCSRKFLWNYEQFSKWKKDEDIDQELLTLESPGVGYFQAFNFQANCLKGVNPENYIPDSKTAENVDALFFGRWYAPPEPKIPKLHFEVLHLGPPGLFNNGRLNAKLSSINGVSFKDLPDLSGNDIFKDSPDIYLDKSRPEQRYNKYYKYFKNSINHRDFVFRMCLDFFNKVPLNILEIGTSRSLNGKAGDGWSTFFWCDYISKNGGKLVVCDIDPAAIENCKTITSDYHNIIDVKFIIGDGAQFIDDSFDLIFLDGSDCPIQMVEQFEKINRKKTIILCDDFHVKGKIVREKYKDFRLIKVNEVHEMAIYHRL